MERKYLKTSAPLLAICALSACLGTGEDQGQFSEFSDSSNAIFNAAEDVPDTDPASMPFSGSATYAGFFDANADLDNDTEDFISVIGESTITVTFGGTSGASAGTLTGTATNFVDSGDGPLPGTLTYAGTYNGATLTATVSGDLEIDEGTITVTGPITGNFSGPDAAFIEARVSSGTITGVDTGRWNASITGQR